jgi:hypothetical protein
MSTKSFVARSAALAALALTVVGGGLAASPAEAGYKKHHHHGFRIVIGAPLVYGGYGYGYRAYRGHRPCYWLYRKAQNTGSRYWWKRFHQCRYGH